MAERLLTHGYPLNIYNRTVRKTQPLVKLGARVSLTPQEALASSQVHLLMLSDAAAISETVFSLRSRSGLKGKILIQMGTIAPQESRRFAQLAHRYGAHYCECPVLGSISEVKAGRLILMFSGTAAQFRKFKSLLTVFGKEYLWLGPVGQAATLKLCLNQLIASHIVGFAQSLALVKQSGLQVKTFMSILRQSALYAPMFDKKLPRLLTRDYTRPNFSTQHMLKDVNLFQKAAATYGINASALQGIARLLAKGIKGGWRTADYCSVYEVINKGVDKKE